MLFHMRNRGTREDACEQALPLAARPGILRQFMRFALVGAVGTAVQYGLLILLVGSAGVNAVAASATGFTAGALINYWLNHRFTFPGRKRHRATVPKFMTVACFGLLLNSAAVGALTGYWRLHYLAAQVVATLLVLCWTFSANRIWTFSESSNGNPKVARPRREEAI